MKYDEGDWKSKVLIRFLLCFLAFCLLVLVTAHILNGFYSREKSREVMQKWETAVLDRNVEALDEIMQPECEMRFIHGLLGFGKYRGAREKLEEYWKIDGYQIVDIRYELFASAESTYWTNPGRIEYLLSVRLKDENGNYHDQSGIITMERGFWDKEYQVTMLDSWYQ